MPTAKGWRGVLGVFAGLLVCLGQAAAQAPAASASGQAEEPWVTSRRTVPGGPPGSSVIDLEQVFPREVREGQPFDYRLRVANYADCPVAEVTVVQHLPEGVTLLGSQPQAEVQDGVATWRLGTLAVREARVIHVRASGARLGPLSFCCDTFYRAPLCTTVVATRPELQLSLEAAPEATPCDIIPVRLVVRNSGSGACREVALQYRLPADMAGPDAQRQYTYQIGFLAPGEARQAELNVRALRTGAFQHEATAVSSDGLRVEALATTRVVAPRLTVAQTGTAEQFAGRDVVYSFTVRNEGATAARNLEVEDLLPAGATLVEMTPVVAMAPGAERVVWRLPSLPAGRAVEFALTMRSPPAAALTNRVSARADCAQAVSARHTAQVKGIPAVLLEVVDLDDPIEVDGQETYVITATNQGSAACTNLRVQCLLEDNLEHADSGGPTPARVVGREVTFSPLARLEPKAVATWNVVCRALTPGDVRFRVLLTSDQLSRPVEETESTRIY